MRVIKALSATTVDISWADVAPASGVDAVYDLTTGRVGELQRDDGFPRALCFQEDVSVTVTQDPRQPPSSMNGPTGFWYLVRGQNACGVGPWGFTSAGVVRDVPETTCSPR